MRGASGGHGWHERYRGEGQRRRLQETQWALVCASLERDHQLRASKAEAETERHLGTRRESVATPAHEWHEDARESTHHVTIASARALALLQVTQWAPVGMT